MNKKRIVISGINGFVGHHLAKKLSENNISVIGVGTDEGVATDIQSFVDEYYSSDLTKEWPKIEDVDGVIHLAGLAAVGPSFDHPQSYINSNSAMVTNLCEFYLTQNKKPRIVVVSSGAIYDTNQKMPLSEESVIGFNSPYAVSKVLTENQTAYYRLRGLDCIIARPFNHIGPGQKTNFLLPDLYFQLTNAKNLNQSTILVGNIETRRDYTDVRDIVDAYFLLVTASSLNSHTYNVASGRSTSGKEIFELLTNSMGLQNINVIIDQSKIRPTDAPDIIGDSSRLQNELEWQPHYSLEQTVQDFVANIR